MNFVGWLVGMCVLFYTLMIFASRALKTLPVKINFYWRHLISTACKNSGGFLKVSLVKFFVIITSEVFLVWQ